MASEFIIIKDKPYALDIIAFIDKYEYEDTQKVRNPSLEGGYATTVKKYYNIKIIFKNTLSPSGVAYTSEEERDNEYERVTQELYNGK